MTPIKARYPISQAQYDAFWADGFLVVPQLIESFLVPMLHDSTTNTTERLLASSATSNGATPPRWANRCRNRFTRVPSRAGTSILTV
jgi:hypothetical protein